MLLVLFLLYVGVGVSCRYSYSIVCYLYASCSGSITSAGEERAVFFCYSLLGAWDRLRYFIVAIPVPSIISL